MPALPAAPMRGTQGAANFLQAQSAPNTMTRVAPDGELVSRISPERKTAAVGAPSPTARRRVPSAAGGGGAPQPAASTFINPRSP
jgi:hypothetical protein